MKNLPQTTPVVACMADQHFAMAVGQVMASICQHFTGPTLDFLLLDYGLTPDHFTRLQRMARRQPVEVRLRRIVRVPLAAEKDEGVFAWVCRDRLQFLDEIAQQHDRLVMLDADLMVHADLNDLWRNDLAGHALGAVRDFGYPTLGSRFPAMEEPEQPYYNTGVLLVDLNAWRDQHLTRLTQGKLNMTRSSHGPFCPDQDAMNLALVGHWQELDPAWNAQMIALQHVERWPDSAWKRHLQPQAASLYQQPRIRHWPGPYKPWQHHPGCAIPFQEEYQHAARTNGWHSRWERWRAALGLTKTCG